MSALYIRAETNIQFSWVFTQLHMYLNIKRVFRYTMNNFSELYFVIKNF